MSIPKITKITGGAASLESATFALSNCNTLGFLFENTAGAKTTVKVKASKDGGAAEAVPFVLTNTATDANENVSAEGKEITDAGAFLAVITDRSLAHDEYDSAALSLSVDTGTITGAFALQAKARYSDE